MAHTVFLSYTREDEDLVDNLRKTLELHGQSTWLAPRELVGGDVLFEEISQAIDRARYFLVVLSLKALASERVQDEVNYAIKQTEQRGQDFKLIPVVLPELDIGHLRLFFEQMPCYILIDDTPTGLDDVMPDIFAALGLQLPRQWQGSKPVIAKPIDELVLKLFDPCIRIVDDQRRVTAMVQLFYYPGDNQRCVTSYRYYFIAPLGQPELEELRWYVESYFRWPTGVFKTRAGETEQALSHWGKLLLNAVLADDSAETVWQHWLKSDNNLRFSIELDFDPAADGDEPTALQYRQAASELLALPWDIIHDGSEYLSHGRFDIQVCRRFPNRHPIEIKPAKLPVRVLLLSPRPEVTEQGKKVGYFDHRSSAKPVIQVMEKLGKSLVKVDILAAPTFSALKKALKQADKTKAGYDIVHFDGHGVFDLRSGAGVLCFEDPTDSRTLGKRLMQPVYANELAAELRRYSVPLVYLEACQSAYAQDDPLASVAACLLEQGVASVVAMSHSVLVETTRRFIEPFYRNLAAGHRVGAALQAGQRALFEDCYRRKVAGAGRLRLHDWFVPVLYQDVDDPQLFNIKAGESTRWLVAKQRKLQLGDLPLPPDHTFVGRSRVLLKLERLLQQANYGVIRGGGGMGKTTVAVELVGWLVACERFQRAVFISVESQNVQDIKGVVDSIGRQLLPKYTVAKYGDDIEQALQPIERALLDYPTIILLDNMESVLPDLAGNNPAGVADVTGLLTLCRQMLDCSAQTRLIFTSREPLPKPFAGARNTLLLERLSRLEAIELVEKVMTDNDWQPPPDDSGMTTAEVAELVESVNGHPRALVLLAAEVTDGVRATTANLVRLMAKLEAQNPGDRENSLYASVELSLRRLPEAVRTVVERLAVLHGGGQLAMLADIINIEAQDMGAVAQMLIATGLAELLEYDYLRFDPALPAYLRLGQSPDYLRYFETRWVARMTLMVESLYDRLFDDSIVVFIEVLNELPNLLALVDWLQLLLEVDVAQAAMISTLGGKMEQLLVNLNRPQAVERVVRLRELATGLNPVWDNAGFGSEFLRAKTLMERGEYQLALEVTLSLLEKVKNATYSGVDYDQAMTHKLLGTLMKKTNHIETALDALTTAYDMFAALACEQMMAVTLTELGDCLRDVGRLDEAIVKYQQRIALGEKLEDSRGIALGKGQLATVLVKQQDFDQAIALHEESRNIFEQQHDLGSVAAAWFQLGMAYQDADDPEAAEDAYIHALQTYVKCDNKPEQASCLLALGTLYGGQLGRFEDEITFSRQASALYIQLGDMAGEGIARNNIANALLKLGRFEQAKVEIQQAIDCKSRFGRAVEPWSSFSIAHQVHTALGDNKAACLAWAQARDAYLDYRRHTGFAQSRAGEMADATLAAIEAAATDVALKELSEIMQEAQVPQWYKSYLGLLQRILKGSRDSRLADNMALKYDAAAEILFVIERLNNG